MVGGSGGDLRRQEEEETASDNFVSRQLETEILMEFSGAHSFAFAAVDYVLHEIEPGAFLQKEGFVGAYARQ